MCTFAQEPLDSARVDSLAEVVVTAFGQTMGSTRAYTVQQVRSSDFEFFNKNSPVQAFNTVAGVRMEERSPGSYRINIRGSSLRSPFGVRNVKVYWNDIPVTDPGGNTYFNQFAVNNFSSIEIFKGPAGSMYGAGTGGLIWARSLESNQRRGVSVEYNAGSYGTQNVLVTANTGKGDNRGVITYAHNESDGYRRQSAMRRDNLSWSSGFRLSARQELQASVLFTDMYYQTPGGLTRAEFTADPRAARPAAGGFPGAEQARATIYQKNVLAGVSHRYKIDTHWSNATVLYAAFAQIRNPTVRNYERRSEPHAGGRTSFIWNKKTNGADVMLQAGTEIQQGFFNTRVFGNRQGMPDTLQTDDDTEYSTYTVFVQGDLNFSERWLISAGGSINRTKVTFTRLNNLPVREQSRTYGKEIAPRLSIVRTLTNNASVFAVAARGFSPPGMAELLPSTGVISTNLDAETGTNYEAGFRKRFAAAGIYVEALVYYFKLNNALVQRRDNSGADYFVNAGDAKQRGVEVSTSYDADLRSAVFQRLRIDLDYAYSHYRYGSLMKDTSDFSRKQLPSVPAHTVSMLAALRMQNGLYLSASYYYASKIFLNDANTAFADPYHLIGCRIGWDKTFNNKFRTHIYAGAENLLDELYSLGNDINDPRGRYYNTAPGRTYYVGIALQIFGR